jgi:hypothetical protein
MIAVQAVYELTKNKQSVKPSAKPTLVRTQHLPPPAETARELGIPGLAGLLCLVPLCFMMCRCEPLRSSDCGHIADGSGAEPAVHRTACSGILNGLPPQVKSPPGSLDDHWPAGAWPARDLRIYRQRDNTADIGTASDTPGRSPRLLGLGMGENATPGQG